MKPAKIRRDARREAFAEATEDDEKALNPWKNGRALSWGADMFAEQWEQEFLRECKRLATEREDDESDS